MSEEQPPRTPLDRAAGTARGNPPARPYDDDLRLLALLATGRAAAEVRERSGRSLHVIAGRLVDLRAHYGVSSTRAVVDRARRLGHLSA